MLMAYNKQDVTNLADKLVAAVDAVVVDGFQLSDDSDELAGVAMAIPPVANEAKDTDAFILHLIEALAGKIGDRRVDPEPPVVQ